MHDKARQGTTVFRHAWKQLHVSQRTLVRDKIGEYEQLARQADEVLEVRSQE